MFARVFMNKFLYIGGISMFAAAAKLPILHLQSESTAKEPIIKPISIAPEQPAAPVPPVLDDEDDETWEKRKQSCSFCKQFLDSPCRIPFRQWSRCVDKAKEQNKEFIEECQLYTRALLNCTSDNAEYFEALKRAAEAEQGEEEDDDDDEDFEEELREESEK